MSVLVGLVVLIAQQVQFDAQTVVNDGWVTDHARLLRPSEEAELERRLETLRLTHEHEVVVLTVPSLNGTAIDAFARTVAERWSVGGRDRGNGVLVVVAQADQMVHIHVGPDFAARLDDVARGRIVRELMVPEFKEGHFRTGLELGAEAILAVAAGDSSPLEQSFLGRSRRGAWTVPIVVLLLLGLAWRSLGGWFARRKAVVPARIGAGRPTPSPASQLVTHGATGKW
ncbi:MAG: TPM domain-containing protein [Planctomycetes bacterium]|nr:TPM domain-containing protein [Planctomycetota bacterium]MCC7172571.1 TPM domain-containing protein [Planctomycetota bacterium]